MSAEAKRLWRYEVDECSDDGPVRVGTVLIDRWKSDRTWRVHDFSRTGNGRLAHWWHCKLLGEVTDPEVLAKCGSGSDTGDTR